MPQVWQLAFGKQARMLDEWSRGLQSSSEASKSGVTQCDAIVRDQENGAGRQGTHKNCPHGLRSVEAYHEKLVVDGAKYSGAAAVSFIH